MSSGYDKYVRGKVLGKGSFGQAVLVTRKDGKNFVIKEIDISRMPKVERESAEQEAKVRAELVRSFCSLVPIPLAVIRLALDWQ
jgi:hypothetical protein